MTFPNTGEPGVIVPAYHPAVRDVPAPAGSDADEDRVLHALDLHRV